MSARAAQLSLMSVGPRPVHRALTVSRVYDLAGHGRAWGPAPWLTWGRNNAYCAPTLYCGVAVTFILKNKPGERLSVPLVLPYDSCVGVQTPSASPPVPLKRGGFVFCFGW